MQYFKRGATWVYRFELSRVNGKRQYEQKGGFKAKTEAEEAGAEALHKYNSTGLTFTPSEISVADYYDIFIKDYCSVNCNRNTMNGYKKRIKNYILPKIGKYRLRSITPALLQELINDMFNQGYSKNTLSTVKGLLSSAFSHAVHPLGLIQYSPATVIKLPSKRAVPKIPTRKKERVPVTDEQWAIIIRRFPEGHPAHLPLMLAHRLGLREGEAFALQYDRDFDFENNIATIARQVLWIEDDNEKGSWRLSLPKYDSVRQVYMDSKLAALIKRTIEKHRQNRAEYADLYTRLFVNEQSQIVTDDTGKELFLLSVRDDGTFISPRTITHALQVIQPGHQRDRLSLAPSYTRDYVGYQRRVYAGHIRPLRALPLKNNAAVPAQQRRAARTYKRDIGKLICKKGYRITLCNPM